MKRRTLQSIALCLSLTAGGVAVHAADDKGSAPAAAPATQPAQRDFAAIMQDIQKEGESLRSVLTSPEALADPAKRQEAAPKAIPVLKRMIALFNEMKAGGNGQGGMIAQQALPQLTTFLAVFGDKDTLAQLEQDSKDPDKSKALDAQGALLLVHWIDANKDAEKQGKLLDEAQQLAKDNPSNEKLTNTLTAMAEIGAGSDALSDKLKDTASGMTTQTAQQLKSQLVGERKLKALENKPLTIEGVSLDGKSFSTADWKGKVIFVDFWATWCGPCREELPRVKKAYADFHDKGLEVLGVSCDNDGEDLKKFLADNKDMPWPQLFDVKKPGWHPLATSYGINGIPTMFLIDKKGVVRSVTARENFEEMIPKLLAEKD